MIHFQVMLILRDISNIDQLTRVRPGGAMKINYTILMANLSAGKPMLSLI